MLHSKPKRLLGMQCFKETVCKFACKATWLDYFNNYYFNSGFYLRKKMAVFLKSCLSHSMVLVFKLFELQTIKDARLLSNGECSPREWTL